MLKVAGFEDQLIMTIHVVQGKGSGVTLNKIERLICAYIWIDWVCETVIRQV